MLKYVIYIVMVCVMFMLLARVTRVTENEFLPTFLVIILLSLIWPITLTLCFVMIVTESIREHRKDK